ncbi:MAG: M20/M25/M40 family metallo-hydrolase [Alphaproteobacteria bacterium]|nr:M20/M25/M40 family metallo-hydrolase [Alphaproteobacteria bacterium]
MFLWSCDTKKPAQYPLQQADLSNRTLRIMHDLSADDMQGREAGEPGGVKARTYLLNTLKEMNIPAGFARGYEQPFTAELRNWIGFAYDAPGVNLLAKIEGESGSGQSLLISAHYDHEGKRWGRIYNGADDNASGVAALFAIAEAFQKEKPKHTMYLAFLDAEEEGLQGAFHFAEQMERENLGCVAFNINLDMISRNHDNELYVAGGYHTPELKPYLNNLAEEVPVTLLQGHDRPEDGGGDWTMQSDHGAFHDAGVPFLYFGVEDHPHYHQPSDEFETVPFDFYLRAVETVVAASKMVDENLPDMGRACGESATSQNDG